MSWREDKFPAQLNGVRFHVDGSRKRGGRRTTAHEFAGLDEAYVEDSGAAPHRYEVTAFLIGDDYHVRLQQLEEVLEQGGPLEFHHPDRGILEGLRIEGEYNTEHRRDRQGFATITFTLVQHGRAIPLIFADERGRVQRGALRVIDAAAATFERKWKRSPLGLVTGALRGLNNKLAGAYSRVLAQVGPIQALQRELRDFERNREKLLASPKMFAAALRGLLRTIMNTFGKRSVQLGRGAAGYGSPAQELVEAASELRSFASGAEAAAEYEALASAGGGYTEKALAAKIDVDVLELLVGATALAGAVEVAVAVPLPTAEAALQLAALLAAELDALLEAEIGLEPLDAEPYAALLELKAAAVNYFAAVAGELPALAEVTIDAGAPVSALLAAFWHWGPTPALGVQIDTLLEANPLIDPLAIQPGEVLQVLG